MSAVERLLIFLYAQTSISPHRREEVCGPGKRVRVDDLGKNPTDGIVPYHVGRRGEWGTYLECTITGQTNAIQMFDRLTVIADWIRYRRAF